MCYFISIFSLYFTSGWWLLLICYDGDRWLVLICCERKVLGWWQGPRAPLLPWSLSFFLIAFLFKGEDVRSQ
jgi:hypothetical protein